MFTLKKERVAIYFISFVDFLDEVRNESSNTVQGELQEGACTMFFVGTEVNM